MRVLPRVFKTKTTQGTGRAEAKIYADASSAIASRGTGCLSANAPSAATSLGAKSSATAVRPTDKENVDNSSQASRPQPIYVSSQPGQTASAAKPGGLHLHQPQTSKYLGPALAPLDVPAAQAASLHVSVEPLTPRKLGLFCPETGTTPPAADFPGSRTSTSELCQELVQLSAILDGEATSTVPNGIKQPSMRLPFKNLKVLERIGENGSQGGEVFAAIYRDPETCTEQHVAVKRYPAFSTVEQLAAFEREVNLMAFLSSRCHHCVRYWGWCQAPDGAIFLVMKRYRQSLNAKLDSLPDRKMPVQQVQRYGKQIAQALAELHAQNVLFLDLKPSNILLDDFDNVAVCDFGISRKSGSESPSGLHGTFNYMSPEAFDEDSYGTLTTKSDVWSFACCIVEMASGCMPWLGTSMAAICYKVASMKEVPAVPSQLPDDVQQLLRQCFDHNSCDRPSFSDIYRVFDKDWTNQPQIALFSSTQVSCTPVLEMQDSTNKRDDIVPASQLVNQVFRNAIREIKERKYGPEACENASVSSGAQVTFASESNAAREKSVRLKTYDNQMVEMPYDLAKRSLTLCWQVQLLEQEHGQDGPAGRDSMIITLNDPSCTLSMVTKVKTYLQSIVDAERGFKTADDLKDVEAMLTNVNEDGIFSLLMVANYLDLPELTYLACKGLNPHVTAADEKHVPLTSQIAPTQPAAEEVPAGENKMPEGAAGNVKVPELPPRKHRFDRENLGGMNPTRSRSSPAKAHQLADGIFYTTDKLLTEHAMKEMLPKQSSPVKQNFLPSAGVLESIADWGKSSWTDLVQPRFAQAAVPPSPARQSPERAKHVPNIGVPIPPARTTRLDAHMLGRSSAEPRTPDKSIHCTPMVANKGVNKALPLDAHAPPSLEAPEGGKMGENTEAQCHLSPLEFRRMIHPDGDSYAGTCKGDLMHGVGVCWYPNGDKYCGQWRAGMRHGIGRMEWNDGHIYEGSWREDLVCPGVRSKIRKDKLGIRRDSELPSPHPLAYRPPMSVHMFRANISRMHGENSSTAPDPLDRLFSKSTRAPTTQHNKDTRGILTHVVDHTQSVAGVFSGMGEFVAAIMSQSPARSTAKPNPQAAAPGSEPEASSLRLRFFRLDAVCDKLVEEEFCDKESKNANENFAASASARAPQTSRDVIYYVF